MAFPYRVYIVTESGRHICRYQSNTLASTLVALATLVEQGFNAYHDVKR